MRHALMKDKRKRHIVGYTANGIRSYSVYLIQTSTLFAPCTPVSRTDLTPKK